MHYSCEILYYIPTNIMTFNYEIIGIFIFERGEKFKTHGIQMFNAINYLRKLRRVKRKEKIYN